MNTFYVATKLENIEEARRLMALLRSWGLEPAYDWTVHGPVWRQGAARMREVAALELGGVRCADVVIVRLPGGRGTHTELGAALAFGQPVIIYGAAEAFVSGPEACAFYYHECAVHVCTDSELRGAVVRALEDLA